MIPGKVKKTAPQVLLAALAVAFRIAPAAAQGPKTQSPSVVQVPSSQENLSPAEAELQKGIALTRNGRFAEAIPHFLAARGHVSNEYAAEFNLALCYVGEDQADAALPVLQELRKKGHDTASVENLLAQAYARKGYRSEAFEALEKAAALAPKDEKLYLYVSDAFQKNHENNASLQTIEAGLQHLPDSARLHYEQGYLLELLDETDAAEKEFVRAKTLAPHSAIGYLAEAHRNLMIGNLSRAVAAARTGIREGHTDYQLLAVLGEGLLRSAASPGQAEFAEAKEALEKSVAARPKYASAQVSLGHMFLLEGNLASAIEHLETGRELDPQSPAAYPLLAAALRKHGQLHQAQEVLAILARLNQEKVQQIRGAPGDSKAIPGASSPASGNQKP